MEPRAIAFLGGAFLILVGFGALGLALVDGGLASAQAAIPLAGLLVGVGAMVLGATLLFGRRRDD